VHIGNAAIHAVTYEGSYPAPTLELNAGDSLAVALQNASTQPTNLHTHGFHVSPSGNSDNVFLQIDPGKNFDYKYDLPADHPAGTYWYHSHLHMYTDDQVFGGQFGMIKIRGEFDELPGIKGLPEKVIILSQTEIKDGAIVEGAKSSLSNQVTLVNGQLEPTVDIAPGELQRWRILNAAVVFYELSLDDQPLVVVATDGNSLTEPRSLEQVMLGPGMRIDVLVRGGASGTTPALQSSSFDSYGQYWESMVPVPEPVVHLAVKGSPPATKAKIPKKLLPMNDLRKAKIDCRRTFWLEEREPRGVGPNEKYSYYINGSMFDPTMVDQRMALGSTEEWVFINKTYEPHPLHIHVNPFQIVEVNGKPSKDNGYRDTAIVPPFGSLTIRHQFLDFTGKFVMHCHILFHEDHGMMQSLEVVPKDQFDPKDAGISSMCEWNPSSIA
jgi:FtsP/CotA-like multicopper oxidase with cupredoxin domain